MLCQSFYSRYKALRRFGVTQDDVHSCGLEIFVLIYPQYDPAKQPSFTVYLMSKMWLRLVNAYRDIIGGGQFKLSIDAAADVEDYRTGRSFDLDEFVESVNPQRREDVRETISILFDKFLKQPTPTKARVALRKHLRSKRKWSCSRVVTSFDLIREALRCYSL